MSQVKRLYVEKKPSYAVKAKELAEELKAYLSIDDVSNVRVLIRYDVENVSAETMEKAAVTVFSEPPVDDLYEEDFPKKEGDRVFSVEYLPGQFDQRADSAMQCLQLLNEKEEPIIRSATTYVFSGNISDEEFEKIKEYCINPVDSRETDEKKPETLVMDYEEPADVAIFDGFKDMPEEELKALYDSLGLAMTFEDFRYIQNYYHGEEDRNPSMTEIRVLDTYWSDHCRHTTFSTELKEVTFGDGYYRPLFEKTYNEYLADRAEVYGDRKDKFICLMDLALMGMKKLKQDGLLDNMEESDEINACSIVVPVEFEDKTEEWLISFKNETHNHPTEIEPFGGAATCLGGAIRDPLSGRSYVYQAMRVTGCADPTVPMAETMKGKLPQRKLTTGAAKGYSSYGNQIGLATGLVDEVYHPGYVAKRMEIGAVIGAAPRKNVIRETSDPGDIIVLLGGRTGRDGCGGATGSSKAHTTKSIDTCGAEVQKGNAPTERKIQRLFRREEVSILIKKCNDFGAGGVSVAIGELADGLSINLDAVTKKYDGLDGTELAISESQERMAVVIAKSDLEKFMAEAAKENLEATMVARVTAEPRLKMNWCGNTIVDLTREFLNSNGAEKHTDISIPAPVFAAESNDADTADRWESMISNLNICSQKGLIERFDSTIGANTVLMPFGGKYQNTPTQAMAAKLPVLHGNTKTTSIMGWGYDPYLSSVSPYHGAMSAVVESIAKVIATGGTYEKCWLTFQEYFERTQNDPERWGKPMSALLGAYKAQIELGCGSIGGKDSMSGTFEEIDVPPTLVSFAVSVTDADKVVSQEFKKAGSKVILIKPEYDDNKLVNFDSLKAVFEKVEKLIAEGKVLSCWAVSYGGVSEAVAKMAFGNKIGFKFTDKLTAEELYRACYGAFVIELAEGVDTDERVIGETTESYEIKSDNYTISLDKLQTLWEGKLEPVYPVHVKEPAEKPEKYSYKADKRVAPAIKVAKPKVLIPVFPGTNCEYDTARAFEKAGAEADIFVVRNLTEQAIKESVDAMEKKIKESQIVMLPGGFSGGDEPDGSGKFIVSFLRNPRLTDAIHDLLKNRDGLMLGICNGFQALIKLGLVPYGEIRDMRDDSPTLTFNTIARHQSKMVNTRIASNKSPWLAGCEVGDIHSVAISHGEGRFVATAEEIAQLAANGQIATQYVDFDGEPTFDIHCNPNTSFQAIEGITSPDGRVLGKMGHSERKGCCVSKNVPGEKDQKIFESGVAYFK